MYIGKLGVFNSELSFTSDMFQEHINGLNLPILCRCILLQNLVEAVT